MEGKKVQKICLLNCQASPFFLGKEPYGSVESVYASWLNGNQNEVHFDLQIFAAYQCELPEASTLDNYNLFVITGSGNSAYDLGILFFVGSKNNVFLVLMLICEEDEWILKLKKLTELLLSQKRNILGICFGHQLLGIIMGGKCEKNPQGWEYGWYSFDVTPEAASLMNYNKKTIALYYFHGDAVTVLPQGLLFSLKNDLNIYSIRKVSMGSTPQTDYQGILSPNVMAFQGHPEMSKPHVFNSFERRKPMLNQETIDAFPLNIDKEVDNNLIVMSIIDYFNLRQ